MDFFWSVKEVKRGRRVCVVAFGSLWVAAAS